MNYEKLAEYPTEYGRLINSKGQEIIFIEHPIQGDEFTVIAMCHKLKLAKATDFFELDDMMADHGEYEPYFNSNGELEYGRSNSK